MKGHDLDTISYPRVLEHLFFSFLSVIWISYAHRCYTGNLRLKCTVSTSGVVPPVNNDASTLYVARRVPARHSRKAARKSKGGQSGGAQQLASPQHLAASDTYIRHRHAPLPIPIVLSWILYLSPFASLLSSPFPDFPSLVKRYQLSRRLDFPKRFSLSHRVFKKRECYLVAKEHFVIVIILDYQIMRRNWIFTRYNPNFNILYNLSFIFEK